MLKPEELLQITCANYLRRMCPDILWWASGNGFYFGTGPTRFAYIAKVKKMGLLPGVPDLQLVWNKGGYPTTAFIELKAPKKKPNEEQALIMADLKRMGFMVEWTDNFDGFLALLKKFEVPCKGKFLNAKE